VFQERVHRRAYHIFQFSSFFTELHVHQIFYLKVNPEFNLFAHIYAHIVSYNMH
jgi:hypothetical protein